jgi:transposase
MKYFLGLDIAKESFVAALVDVVGELLRIATFSNTSEGFAELVAWLDAPAATLAVCEPTGVYGKRLQQALATAVGSLHEINAQSLRRFSFSQVQTKTDEADALAIARAARTLHLTQPELLKNSRVCCDLPRENLALWLGEYDRLRITIATLRQQIDNLNQHVAPDARQIQRRRKQALARLLKEQRQVHQEIVRSYQKLDDHQAELIDSIPGIGALSTAALLVVVRDVQRFRSADALKAYLGIYPRRKQSGKREGKSGLAHHGNPLVRHMLWNAAKAAVRVKHPQNPFRALFDRLVAKGKSQSAAYGAVCRKLVQVVFGVLKSQTPFQFPLTAA